MKNPFQYGGIVEGAAFCNRKKELADLTRAVESGEKLFLYSERRLGKTSLVHAALRRLPKEAMLPHTSICGPPTAKCPSWRRPRGQSRNR